MVCQLKKYSFLLNKMLKEKETSVICYHHNFFKRYSDFPHQKVGRTYSWNKAQFLKLTTVLKKILYSFIHYSKMLTSGTVLDLGQG